MVFKKDRISLDRLMDGKMISKFYDFPKPLEVTTRGVDENSQVDW